MEQQTVTNMNFDEVISLLKSNNINTDTRSIIYKSLGQIIKKDYNFDCSEPEYRKIYLFFVNLINLREIDLIKKGLKIYNDNNGDLHMYCHLGIPFLKNEMLKQYYEIISEYNYNKYFIKGILIVAVDNMFYLEPNKVCYLVTETAIFATQNKEYQLIEFLVARWNSTDLKTKGFEIKEMSDNDIELTTKTIKDLEYILNSRI